MTIRLCLLEILPKNSDIFFGYCTPCRCGDIQVMINLLTLVISTVRPPELELLTSPFFNLDHLIDVAHVANKYSFKSLETWALDAIQEYVNRKPSPILGTIPSPIKFFNFGTDHQPSSWPSSVSSQKETANQLTRLIRLAQLCQHERLMNTMVNLLRQLMSSSVHYAYLAMTLSDELGLRTLRGASYLEVMQKVTVVKKVDVVKTSPQASTASSSASISSLIQTQANTFSREGAVDPSGRLIITQAQQLRLLSGYYRLTSFWDNLRLSPPQLEHSQSCAATWHQQGCMQSWLEFWKEKTRSDAVMGLGVADVIGRMKLLEKDYERWGSATYMHADCRSNAKKTISDIIKKVEDALPDFFEEPGGCIED